MLQGPDLGKPYKREVHSFPGACDWIIYTFVKSPETNNRIPVRFRQAVLIASLLFSFAVTLVGTIFALAR